MSSEFPASIFIPRETENLPGIEYDATKKRFMFSEDFQNLGIEINALETFLHNIATLTDNGKKVIRVNDAGDSLDFSGLFVSDAGYVGIGIDDPENTLDVHVAVPSLGSNIVPVMTGDSAPSPYVASANDEEYGQAYLAFDHDPTTSWGGCNISGHNILALDLGAIHAQPVNKYIMGTFGNPSGNNTPKSWSFEGSNDGSSWTVLDSQVNISWTDSYTEKSFNFSNSASFRYYRLDITAINSGGCCSVYELQLINTSDVDDEAFNVDPTTGDVNMGTHGGPAQVSIKSKYGVLTGGKDLLDLADKDGNSFFRVSKTGQIGIKNDLPAFDFDINGALNTTGYNVGGVAGASGSFTTVDLKTVTVVSGIITSIV